MTYSIKEKEALAVDLALESRRKAASHRNSEAAWRRVGELREMIGAARQAERCEKAAQMYDDIVAHYNLEETA